LVALALCEDDIERCPQREGQFEDRLGRQRKDLEGLEALGGRLNG